MPNLEEFKCCFIGLKKLPESLYFLPKLKKLTCKYNQISEFSDSIGNLKKLERLICCKTNYLNCLIL